MTSLVASVEIKLSGAVFAALLLFVLGHGTFGGTPLARELEKQTLTFVTEGERHAVTVEVADSEAERATGLMFRRSLGEDEGMIFIYPEDQTVSMWMKNTYIPLDMIFVKSDGTIHHIERHAEPFSEQSISSQGEVRAVIEMIAGSADRLGLKPGDTVDYPAFQ